MPRDRDGTGSDGGPDGDSDATVTKPDERADRRVRPARPTDADAIRALQSYLRSPSPDLLEYGIAAESALVSVADRRVVGYALPVDARGRAGLHLAELVVAPDHRREGRARGLLRRAIATVDGPVTLQVHVDNDAARQLYADADFEVVERRPDAYSDGDGLLLRRE